MISGQWTIELILFLIGIAFAVGFTVGYRTRLCAIASWFLLSSMQFRNPVVVHGGDILLRLLLFWCMFAPLNLRFSLDRAFHPVQPEPSNRHLSPASTALLLQVCTMYWFAAADKMHPVWLTERSAVYYALNLDIFSTSLGRAVLSYPALLGAMSLGTVVLEFLGPIFALSPVRNAPIRLVVVAAFIVFHASLGASLRLASFPWVCGIAWLAFLPGLFWDAIANLQDRWARSAGHDRWSWTNGRRSSALRRLSLWVMDEVEKRPHLRAAFTPPRPTERLPTYASLIVVACLGLLVWGLVLGPNVVRPDLVYGKYRKRLAGVTTLGQQWSLFSPQPAIDDGWFVMEGIKPDGTRVDVWNGGGEPRFEKPLDFTAGYRNEQWIKFLFHMNRTTSDTDRAYFARYLCRNWNENHAAVARVKVIEINYMLELTPPPGRPLPSAKRKLLLTYDCLNESIVPTARAAPDR
jgi:hypothetical protein